MHAVQNIISVCRWLPSPDNPTAGLFVLRRLEAMARLTEVEAVQPIPYFPGIRPIPAWAKQPSRRIDELAVTHRKMFYTPKILKSLDGYWLHRSILPRVRAANERRRVDVIDAHFGYPDGVGAFLTARRLEIPLFVTFRGLETDYLDDHAIARQIGNALRHAAGCICVSHTLRDIAIRYGADPGKVRVIHNAVDRALFSPGDRAEARASLALAPTAKLVVSVGHLAAVKGHRTLLDAFARARERAPNARLAIIGGAAHEPDHPRELAARVAELGLGDAVTFVGTVRPAEVARWLRGADLFALATRREGCCNAVLEALATGTPVVTTPVGDNAHFVKDGQNGFLTPAGDAEALAAMLSRALDHPRWDAATISNALEVGEWEQVAARVLEFFNERLLQEGASDQSLGRRPMHATPREQQ